MLFGRKQPDEKTVLVLDIENGSVGAALARISKEHAPRLFGEVRKRVRMLPTRDARTLTKEVERALGEVLLHTNEVAARVRQSGELAPVGEVSRSMVFLRAPWVHVDFNNARLPTTAATDEFLHAIQGVYGDTLLQAPLSFHSFGVSTAPILHTMFEEHEPSLIAIIGGEVTELFVTDGGAVRAYATIPLGSHALLRTLKTHSGLSDAEIYSLLRLQGGQNEALRAAAAHFASEFGSIARALLHTEHLRNVFVLGEAPFGTWFAKTLAEGELGEVFTEGGEVRALHPRHIAPYLSAHAGKPDVPLMLASLFADQHMSVYT